MNTVALALMLALGCSKKEEAPEFHPPRKLRPTVEDLAQLTATYDIADSSEVSFVTPAREHSPQGTFSRITGKLVVDALDLRATRGTIQVDLTSLSMHEGVDAGKDAATVRALNWLGLGEQVPSPERERARFAEFQIDEIRDLSARAAHEGSLERLDDKNPSKSNPDLGEPEVRSVRLTALGSLRLRFAKVRVSARLEALFHYASPALTGVLPEQISLATRSGIPVSLQAHEILPRNSAGILLAEELSLLGRQVGREAKVSAKLVAKKR